MLALAAGHVVASLILLDSRRAGRALARVRQDPVGCLRLVDALQGPLCELSAAAGLMAFFPYSTSTSTHTHAHE
jgi:hypothetical protein